MTHQSRLARLERRIASPSTTPPQPASDRVSARLFNRIAGWFAQCGAPVSLVDGARKIAALYADLSADTPDQQARDDLALAQWARTNGYDREAARLRITAWLERLAANRIDPPHPVNDSIATNLSYYVTRWERDHPGTILS